MSIQDSDLFVVGKGSEVKSATGKDVKDSLTKTDAALQSLKAAL